MIPYLIVDPRNSLQKARRPELAKFAKANGIKEFVYPNGRREPIDEAPAVLIRQELAKRGLTRIPIPNRSIGTMPGGREPRPMQPQTNGVEVDAEADLARQFMEAPKSEAKPVSEMDIRELRSAAKARGVKLERTDNMAKIREKLGG